MEKFNTFKGIAAPFNILNVDTDKIIPKQFLTTIKRTGLGKHVFDEMRYKKDGSKNADFVLNQKPYDKSNILIAGDNFGCGSSREHAVWALKDFGITTVIAPSFGDIFFNNCFKNGILAIQISKSNLEKIFSKQSETKPLEISVDLVNQKIFYEKLFEENFEIDPYRKKCLIEGLDEIGYSLKYEDEINKFEQKLRKERSWVIND